MSDPIIRNPKGAYGYTAVSSDTPVIREYQAGGTVGKGQIVKIQQSAGALTVVAAAATTDPVIGVANNAATSGDIVQVTVLGTTQVQSSGAGVAQYAGFSTTSGGQVAANPNTNDAVSVGFLLEAEGLAGVLVSCYVQVSRQ
jgi:hypothetical protein